jgi:hypothetical protein
MKNPFKLILKGLRWVLNRPETSFAALILPGLGYAKAALILQQMMRAEDEFTKPGNGPDKLAFVLFTLRKLEQEGVVDLGLTDGELSKYIAALVPAVEKRGEVVEVNPKSLT